MSVSKRLHIVAALAAATVVSIGAVPAAEATTINYVDNQSMSSGASVCAQSCFYASRTFNEVFRPNLYSWILAGVQSGGAWSYSIANTSVNPFYVTTGSNRWPLTAACQNNSGATRSSITCVTDY